MKRITLKDSDLDSLLRGLTLLLGTFEVPPTPDTLRDFSECSRLRERLYRVQEDDKHLTFKI